MRTHIFIPDELVASIDRLVGTRSRSKFLAEAASEKLAKLNRVKLAKKLAGSLADIEIPGWETGKETVNWIRNSRKSNAR